MVKRREICFSAQQGDFVVAESVGQINEYRIAKEG
jgi:hypothetical protein